MANILITNEQIQKKKLKLINTFFFIFFNLISYTVNAETIFELDFKNTSGDVITWFEKKKLGIKKRHSRHESPF